MYAPTISTRTTNVELTKYRQILLTHKLFPLGRLTTNAADTHFDVVVRQDYHAKACDKYFVSVKFTTPGATYMTVAIASRFKKALNQACSVLARQVIKTKKRSYKRRQAESIWRHNLQWT